jgi:adenosylcobinamide-GDP ribazoletransferase
MGLGTACLLVAAPGAGPAAAAAGLAAVLGLAALARRHLGGYTGDGLGASEQGAEIAVLTVLATVR